MTPIEQLCRTNVEFLRQGRQLIASLDDGAYNTVTAPSLSTSPVGCHFRHCLDFYGCFLRGLDSGRIDYDARSRNLELESDRRRALATLDELIDTFERLGGELAEDEPVQVLLNGSEEPIWSHSTVLRELQSLISHTVHHYALISLLLRAGGVRPDTDFGVAPSTLAYRRQVAPCSA